MKVKNLDRLQDEINGCQYIISIQRNDDEGSMDYYLIKKDMDKLKLYLTHNAISIIINQDVINLDPNSEEYKELIKLLKETSIDDIELLYDARASKKHTI